MMMMIEMEGERFAGQPTVCGCSETAHNRVELNRDGSYTVGEEVIKCFGHLTALHTTYSLAGLDVRIRSMTSQPLTFKGPTH